MRTVKQLKDARAVQVEALEALQNKETLNADETKAFDAAVKSIEDLDLEIERAEKAEKLISKSVGSQVIKTGPSAKEVKELKNYSFMKAIQEGVRGNLTGLEREMHEEANREKSASGIYNESTISIPSFLSSKRALDVATEGTDLVATENANSIIPVLRPNPIVDQMGATILSGLVGDIDLPRHSGATSATWEGENDANAESTPTFNKISLSPNRLGAYTELSKQLLAQRSPSIDAMVRGDLERAIATALDVAAINGTGSGQPLGILGTSGIGDVAGGTNGAVPTFANIVGLETAVDTANALMGNLGYLTTPGIKGALKTKVKESGQASYVYQSDNTMNGYNAYVSSSVPSALTKGSSSDCHAIIFGNWSELIIAQWAGVDIVVDPYSLSKTAKIQLVINAWYDVAVRRAASFAAMKDALTA